MRSRGNANACNRKIDPGTSTYHSLTREIRAGGNLPFTLAGAPALPKLSGGRDKFSVTVGGFAQVIPQTR